MRTKVLPNSMLSMVKRNALAYTALRTIRMQGGRLVPPRRVEGIPGRVHFNDFMYSGEAGSGVEWYLGGAKNVIGLLEQSLATVHRSLPDIRAVIDFGCGYGRVIRVLVEQVEPRRVYATDVIREGVAFCASEFGVNPIFAPGKGLPNLPPTDLLYAISVLTHLPANVGRDVLSAWGASIEPNGVLLFTTHGTRHDFRSCELRNRQLSCTRADRAPRAGRIRLRVRTPTTSETRTVSRGTRPSTWPNWQRSACRASARFSTCRAGSTAIRTSTRSHEARQRPSARAARRG